MKQRLSLVLSLATLLTPLGAVAADVPHQTLPSVPHTDLQQPAPARGPYLPVPPGATLDGEVKPTENGYDQRIFRSQLSYREAIGFYDRTFRVHRTAVVARRVTADRATFDVRRPHEGIATVVVRRTQPTTLIETREPW
jgi:hypothetical protein